MPPDLIEITCAHCRHHSENALIPADRFLCPKCGAELEAVVVQVVHRISTTVVKLPSDFSEFDPTPVSDAVPLPRAREAG